MHQILVCNPRRNALLKEGSKSEKVDARKLAELLRAGLLRPVYHGENGLRVLRELGRRICAVASHPSAQNALGWGTPQLGWRTQKASVGHPRRRARLQGHGLLWTESGDRGGLQ